MPYKKLIALFTALFLSVAASEAFSAEAPVIDDSTLIGSNYGYPSGVPGKGRPLAGELDLVAETVVYTKNLELVGVEVGGETFIGFFSPIRMRYGIDNNITLEAGAFLGYDFGDGSNFDETEPILRLVYEPVADAFIAAGTIIRTHAIHDALLDDAAAFNENTEQGLQFRADFKNIKQDAWINWRVREETDRSERFDTGWVTQYRSGDLFLDAQLLLRHTGGQKNSEDIVAYNTAYLLGGSYGLYHGVEVPFLKRIEEVRVSAHYLGDHDVPDNDSDIPVTNGSGIEGKIIVDTRPSNDLKLSIFASYFKGDDLLALAGDPLYAKDEYAQVGINLIHKLPAGFRIEFGVDGQFIEGTFAHTEQVYFVWGRSFSLLKGI